MEKLLSDLKGHSSAWPFLQPVNAKEVPDYYEVIAHPMGPSVPFTLLPHSLALSSLFSCLASRISRGNTDTHIRTDFSTMEHKLDTNQYTDTDAFLDDAQLVFDNCRSYNPEDTVYHKCAIRLERYMREQMKVVGLVRSSKVKREREE